MFRMNLQVKIELCILMTCMNFFNDARIFHMMHFFLTCQNHVSLRKKKQVLSELIYFLKTFQAIYF